MLGRMMVSGLALAIGMVPALGWSEAKSQDAHTIYEPMIRAYHSPRRANPDTIVYNSIRLVGPRETLRGEQADLLCVNYTMSPRFIGVRQTILAAVWVRNGQVLDSREGQLAHDACAA